MKHYYIKLGSMYLKNFNLDTRYPENEFIESFEVEIKPLYIVGYTDIEKAKDLANKLFIITGFEWTISEEEE